MARVKGAMMTRKRRNKTLKLAKGYWGNKSRHFKMANEQVMKSLTYAYVGRRLKKRDFRSLWITRISAACKLNGMNYSTFMHGLKTAGNRDQPQDAQRDGHQRSRRFHQARRDREERLILFAKKTPLLMQRCFLFSAQNAEKIITTERGRNA